jgi:hypothetical protein
MSYWEGVSSEKSSDGPTEHIKTDPTVTPGFYACEVVDFMAFSRDGSPWKTKFTLRIIEGAHRDKYLVRWSEMIPERKRANLDLFTNTLGELPAFDPQHGFADLAQLQSRLKGAVVKVKTETWKGRNGSTGLNVYINQLVSSGGAQDVAPQSEAIPYTEDEAIPF